MSSSECTKPSSGSKWWWSTQSGLLFLVLALPLTLRLNPVAWAFPLAATLMHAALFLVGVRILMEQ